MINSMDRININDVYLVTRPWEIRVGVADRIAVIVKEKHEHYAVCEPVLFPSYYGMSKPYKISYPAIDLRPEFKIESFVDLMHWLNKRPHMLDYYRGAAKGYEREVKTLKAFNEYLDSIKMMYRRAGDVC